MNDMTKFRKSRKTNNYAYRQDIAYVDGSYHGIHSFKIPKQYVKDFWRKGDNSAKIS